MPGKKLVVIGGGAAGFFCAVNAARLDQSLEVILLEKTGKLLSKVRVSGGGRCNVTHACFDIKEMSLRYPRGEHFVRKAFHQFFTVDTIKWFEERGVKIKAEPDGRMFPQSNSSQAIIDCLLQEANLYGVTVRNHAEVKKIITGEHKFSILLGDNEKIEADFICVASGGYPKSEMFDWLTANGHSVSIPVPSLFTFNLPGHEITNLTGVSVENVRIKIEGTRLVEEGPLLITHWGLSGPAVLRLSAWGANELKEKNYSFKIHVNWIPAFNEQTLKSQFKILRSEEAGKKLVNLNFAKLPARLWQFLLTTSGIDTEIRMSDLNAKLENNLIRNLADQVFEVKGKTTFKEEFVTAGGIKLNEVDPNTMMSKKLPGLFFAGEVLDVDGITGGFNFQHAWTSGYIAAKTICSKQ